MKLSIFLAISIDNFPSISCQATRFGWSMSALPCPQMFCIFHFSTMQMRFPVQHNAELCSHAAFDMETGSNMSPYLYLEDFCFLFSPSFPLVPGGEGSPGSAMRPVPRPGPAHVWGGCGLAEAWA